MSFGDIYKEINDHYGHDIGDRVLMKIARMLENFRKIILVARYGGEEFLLMIPVLNEDEIYHVGRQICQKTEQLSFFEDSDEKITVSLGAVCYNRDQPLEMQIKRADEALYRAKRAGRNCIKMWEEEICESCDI